MDEAAAIRLLAKLRAFVEERLDDEERGLFATLLAPGVAQAHAGEEVAGFAVTGWTLSSLPEALSRQADRPDQAGESGSSTS